MGALIRPGIHQLFPRGDFHHYRYLPATPRSEFDWFRIRLLSSGHQLTRYSLILRATLAQLGGPARVF